jgi:hypothetical protein
VKKHRSIVALLLVIALPYSAAAAMAEGLRCHHEGLGALTDAGAMVHHDHAAMMHAHYAGVQASSNGDCPIKCVCAGHCAGGGGSAALVLSLVGITPLDNDDQIDGSYRSFFSDPLRIPLFRPPIAALQSAA